MCLCHMSLRFISVVYLWVLLAMPGVGFRNQLASFLARPPLVACSCLTSYVTFLGAPRKEHLQPCYGTKYSFCSLILFLSSFNCLSAFSCSLLSFFMTAILSFYQLDNSILWLKFGCCDSVVFFCDTVSLWFCLWCLTDYFSTSPFEVANSFLF